MVKHAGKIYFWNIEENKFGFRDMKDNKSFESPINGLRLRRNDIVVYERQISGNNITATNIEKLNKRNLSHFESDFINPYNFVRVEKPKNGDRFPYSKNFEKYHDKTYTGKLHCTLKNISPLFIPDTTTKKEEEVIVNRRSLLHPQYDHVKLYGKPIIPATSIKGMIRSVFETITNSCFSQFGEEEEKINFRETGGNELRPGIILSLPTDRNNPGCLLSCSMKNDQGREEHIWADKYLNMGDYYYDSRDREKKYTIETLPITNENGDFITFNLSDKLNYYKQTRRQPIRFNFYHAYKFGLGSFKGFLKITGKKSDSNKHDERVFYHENFDTNEFNDVHNSKDLCIVIAGLTNQFSNDIYKFNFDELHKYESIQRTQLKSGVAHIKKDNESFKDGTVYYHKGLKPGDLIYFKENANNVATNISYVAIPKKAFNNNPYDLLRNFSDKLLPCEDVNQLCPACNVFGASDLQNGDKKVSISGKVRFTNAISDRVSDLLFAMIFLLLIEVSHLMLFQLFLLFGMQFLSFHYPLY